MYLSKDQILGASDATYAEVDVPEWGGKVRIGSITAAEKSKYQTGLFKFDKDGNRTINEKNLETLSTRLIAACVVDGEGERVFDEKDVAAIGKKNAAVIERVFKVCQEHNGMEPPKKDEIVDDIEGN